MGEFPPKRDVAGTRVSVTTYQGVVEQVLNRESSEALAIACCNVHSVMSARQDPKLRETLNSFQIATPDGMPLVWVLRAVHGEELEDRVYGPDLMLAVLRAGLHSGQRHFLLGGTEDSLAELKRGLERQVPGVQLCGSLAPPMSPVEQMDVPR